MATERNRFALVPWVRLGTATVLYFSLGCFVVRDQFVNAAGTIDVSAWSPGLLLIGLGGLIGGLLQKRIDPAYVGYLGAALFAAGFASIGLTTTYLSHWVAFELLIGCGSGIAYAAGIPLVIRQLPNHYGLALGIAVAGYVPAGTVGARATEELIERAGWQNAALLSGITLFVLAAGAIAVLHVPVSKESERDPGRGEESMVRTPSFVPFWLSYALATSGAMMTYTLLPGYVATAMTGLGRTSVEALIETIGRVFTIANFAARPTAGWLTDRVAGNKVLGATIATIVVGSLLTSLTRSSSGLLVAAFLVLAGYGALLAIYPSLTTAMYGARSVGVNYGIVFGAWAFGSVFGRWLARALVRTFGGTQAAFFGATVVSLFALWLAGRAAARHAVNR